MAMNSQFKNLLALQVYPSYPGNILQIHPKNKKKTNSYYGLEMEDFVTTVYIESSGCTFNPNTVYLVTNFKLTS